MWQGREVFLCTLAFLAGNVAGDALSFPPAVFLLLAAICAVLLWLRPCGGLSILCLFMLGAASVQTGRMPPEPELSSLMAWAARCKAGFSESLAMWFPEGDELAVLRALSIGDKGSLTRDLRAAYRESGAMHLLALSGLHVGLVYALLSWLLKPLGGSRTARMLRSVLLLAALWAYALITGLSASISRAVLMISFYEISGLLSGDRDALAALSGSAFILMLANPEAPRDIGFQLSYTAVLSIILLHPWLSGLLRTRSPLLSRVWALLSMSLCCQATCGMLAWLYFGTFPRYFLLTAIMAVPLATASLYAAVTAVALHALSAFLPIISDASVLAAEALRWILHLLNSLIRLIASL